MKLKVPLTSWRVVRAFRESGKPGLTEFISIGVKWFIEAWAQPSLMNESTEDLSLAILKSHKSYIKKPSTY